MADARPRFQVDPAFNDSKELLSIPRRYRLAARGAWEAAGCWSCNKLTDGWVPVSALKAIGVTPLLADYLMDATLWVPGASRVILPSVTRDGDDVDVLDVGPRPDVWTLHVGPTSVVQFNNWPKWQMTRARWLAGNESAKKRAQDYRKRKKQDKQDDVTRDESTTSRVTQNGSATTDDDTVTHDASHRREEISKWLSRELSAVGSADSPPPPMAFPDHCTKHRHNPEPGGCNDCRRVREQNRYAAQQATAEIAAARTAARQRQLDCTACGGDGFVQVDPDDPDPFADVMPCPVCRGDR